MYELQQTLHAVYQMQLCACLKALFSPLFLYSEKTQNRRVYEMQLCACLRAVKRGASNAKLHAKQIA